MIRVRPRVADLEQMREERDEARSVAYVLAHAYEHDSRPPPEFVAKGLSWPRRPTPEADDAEGG